MRTQIALKKNQRIRHQNHRVNRLRTVTRLIPKTTKPNFIQTFNHWVKRLYAYFVHLLSIFTLFLLSSQANSTVTSTKQLSNQLTDHPSQYLQMHATDPVRWQKWNQGTLELAKKLNRPILISSGYFACHWCHVMQQENYQNSQTAALINRHFIAIKIDRELNTELDSALVEFAKSATGQGGWPQHVILTPNGEPFAAFIYLPNKALNLRLMRITELWQKDPNSIIQLARQHIKSTQSAASEPITPAQFKRTLLNRINQQKDDLSGGLSGVAKFPNAVLLNSLLQEGKLPDALEEWMELSLEQIQNEHLYDAIHGGFYRYTIDPEWQLPHFEKMFYDNALLVKTFLLASGYFENPQYRSTAFETLSYLKRHLFNSKTGLYQSSESAMNFQGVEGGQYLFNKSQLAERLTAKEYALVASSWGLDSSPPFEQGWHPRKIKHALWPALKAKLAANPADIPRDGKSNIGWNGLMLSSLSLAYSYSQNATDLKQATNLATTLVNILSQKNPPRAYTVKGTPIGQAKLDDYAYVIQGLKDYQDATHSTQFETQITAFAQTMKHKFFVGHWQYDEAPLLSIQNRPSFKDSAIPSVLSYIHCYQENSLTPITNT